MPTRSLPDHLAVYLTHGLPARPHNLELLLTQGRIVGRQHKSGLFGEIDRYKRAATLSQRPTLQALWDWVNSVQFPPHGTIMVGGKLHVLVSRKPVRGFFTAWFVTEKDNDSQRGYGGSQDEAIADLCKHYQYNPDELDIKR